MRKTLLTIALCAFIIFTSFSMYIMATVKNKDVLNYNMVNACSQIIQEKSSATDSWNISDVKVSSNVTWSKDEINKFLNLEHKNVSMDQDIGFSDFYNTTVSFNFSIDSIQDSKVSSAQCEILTYLQGRTYKVERLDSLMINEAILIMTSDELASVNNIFIEAQENNVMNQFRAYFNKY
ncbi:hypothetical protein [Zophobihabitans entericus]|uniref:Uncharacterized protein n=1 Tax=Zophobihabitans entericus TaxID=1635327 RepID=A0A6G9IC32_9GAMM|nr:hypothetical protein [Zophobihabitans entericus]QIQ21773.1 hypothetical protein IPMB12_08805 [Zophobihabitans entericus]